MYSIAIDTGGTFTDCIAKDTEGRVLRTKVLSNSTLRATVVTWLDSQTLRISTDWQLTRDILRGYTLRLLSYEFQTQVLYFEPTQLLLGLQHPLPAELHGQLLGFELTAHEEAPVLAARIVTQTALDEVFPPLHMKLGSTKGTNALLEQKGSPTVFFVTRGFRDLLLIGNQTRPDIFALNVQKPQPLHDVVVEIDEQIAADGTILEEINVAHVHEQIIELCQNGYQTVALCLKNAYQNPTHEQQLAHLLRQYFRFVSVSSELSGQIKMLYRAETAVVNAYLSPVIKNYLSNIEVQLPPQSLQVMTSAGNLVKSSHFQPKDSLLSGPAGGVVGAAVIAQRAGYTHLLTFDMGGTSTDVARYDGDFDFQFEQQIGSAHIFSPSLAIETVAAGGGSICYFDGYKLCVGPESASAHPGPACYGAGGPLTITDVNLLLGRLDASQFGIPVVKAHAQQRLDALQAAIAHQTQTTPSTDELLLGFLQIANEKMAEAVRKISVSKGYNPTDYALVSFGGAGGLHACAIADGLNIATVILPQDAGLLSAYGIGEARIERFTEKQILRVWQEDLTADLTTWFELITQEAVQALEQEHIEANEIEIRKRLIYLRLKGQDSSLELPYEGYEATLRAFRARYEAVYGYWNPQQSIEVESIRVIAAQSQPNAPRMVGMPLPYPATPTHSLYALIGNDWQEVPVFNRAELTSGAFVEGPALLLDRFSTAVVQVGWRFRVTVGGTGILERTASIAQTHNQATNQAIDLELFTNRFTSIAENMGVMLQRTSLSVNVKERLDFSCALVDAKGELIANAPHIPVHLGSLGVCVRQVIKAIEMQPGDTIITNHPGFGGSHLPDVTLISPVYEAEVLLGYVVNRCHHAEIGGIRPASMPPDAQNLAEEGVVIPPTYLVRNHEVRWAHIRQILSEAPYPSRSVNENLADLNAALAANRHGTQALRQLASEHGIAKVAHYMEQLKAYSAHKIQERIAQLSQHRYTAEEYLDDGTRLAVTITKSSQQTLSIDFEGTAGVHPGNLNGNEAIVQSVVVYVLRTLLAEKVPLNDGILRPITLIIPEPSILKPHFDADPTRCPAVVGGNVELSQRLTDTLLKALGVVACSQGTMNNTLFGNDNFGYYETICGGCGAGEGFDGASGVHHHMTNTRITDPEVIELRYPVRLRRFAIRHGSGGKGQWKGGDGIEREILFLEPVTLSILSQHRQVPPYGLLGGEAGQVGSQHVVRSNGAVATLQGIDGTILKPGDTLVVRTPGGGGYGAVSNDSA